MTAFDKWYEQRCGPNYWDNSGLSEYMIFQIQYLLMEAWHWSKEEK